jgi:uncharacterized protein YjbJ (UPF0337 family)
MGRAGFRAAASGENPDMSEHDREHTTRVKGKVKKKAGWLAGDREVEAKGRVEAEKGHEPTPAEEQEEEAVVRAEHGDI